MIVELETKASDHNCNPFLSEKFNPCCNDFLLEFEEKRTIVAILFYLRNPTVVAMIFLPEFEGKLTIVAILFYPRNRTVVSMIFKLEIKANLTISNCFFQ